VCAAFGTSEAGKRLVLTAAIAGAARGDKIARVIAAAPAVGYDVVKRDVCRMRAMQVFAAIYTGEMVAQVDGEAKVSAYAHAFILAIFPSVVCCLFHFVLSCFVSSTTLQI